MRADFQHAKEHKLVAVTATVKMNVKVPADWDDDMVEFFYNESSSCQSNLVDQLSRERTEHDAVHSSKGSGPCFCGRIAVKVDHGR